MSKLWRLCLALAWLMTVSAAFVVGYFIRGYGRSYVDLATDMNVADIGKRSTGGLGTIPSGTRMYHYANEDGYDTYAIYVNVYGPPFPLKKVDSMYETSPLQSTGRPSTVP